MAGRACPSDVQVAGACIFIAMCLGHCYHCPLESQDFGTNQKIKLSYLGFLFCFWFKTWFLLLRAASGYSRLGQKEKGIAVCTLLLLEKAGTKRWVLPYRHCSPGNQTMSHTSPGGNGTTSGAQSSVLSYEDTTLWPLSSINCIIVAFVFSKGKPFRKPIYTNCE